MTRLDIVGERSTIAIQARSSVGPIAFEATGPTGWIDAAFRDGALDLSEPPTAELELELARLTSGNDVYDAELRRRIDVRRHPTTSLRLSAADRIGEGGRVNLVADLTFHGVQERVAGVADLEVATPERIVMVGEKLIDIRDFRIPAPSMLMLKIYPEVRVFLFVEATAAG